MVETRGWLVGGGVESGLWEREETLEIPYSYSLTLSVFGFNLFCGFVFEMEYIFSIL